MLGFHFWIPFWPMPNHYARSRSDTKCSTKAFLCCHSYSIPICLLRKQTKMLHCGNERLRRNPSLHVASKQYASRLCKWEWRKSKHIISYTTKPDTCAIMLPPANPEKTELAILSILSIILTSSSLLCTSLCSLLNVKWICLANTFVFASKFVFQLTR